MRIFESLNRCVTTCTARPSISSVFSTTCDFRRTATNPVGSPTRTTERNRGVERARARAGAMSLRDSKSLVTRMMKALQYMSDAAYEKLKVSYEDTFEVLKDAKTTWVEHMAVATARSTEEEFPRNLYGTLMGQLNAWLNQLPVSGFNSGKCDLNTIKQFLIPQLLLE